MWSESALTDFDSSSISSPVRMSIGALYSPQAILSTDFFSLRTAPAVIFSIIMKITTSTTPPPTRNILISACISWTAPDSALMRIPTTMKTSSEVTGREIFRTRNSFPPSVPLAVTNSSRPVMP